MPSPQELPGVSLHSEKERLDPAPPPLHCLEVRSRVSVRLKHGCFLIGTELEFFVQYGEHTASVLEDGKPFALCLVHTWYFQKVKQHDYVFF